MRIRALKSREFFIPLRSTTTLLCKKGLSTLLDSFTIFKKRFKLIIQLKRRVPLKKIILGVLVVVGISALIPTKSEAALDLPVRSISGTIYQDINENGILDINQLEFGLKGESVSLFNSLTQAKTGEQPVKTVTTNSLGGYAFTSLKQGEYFLRYNKSVDKFRAVTSEKSAVDGSGTKLPHIISVKVDNKKLSFIENLPLSRVTNLSITPFNDYNWNGAKEESEEIIHGKTMIVLDIKRFASAYSEGRLGTIDAGSIISGALLSGDVDLLDGVYLRTSKDGQSIQIPDATSGAYLVVRSPFNLTIGDMLTNQEKIKAIITIMQNGDIGSLLTNNTLLSTGDIDTNNDNQYLQKLATVFSRLAEETDKINVENVLGSTGVTLTTQVSTQFKQLSGLLNTLPAFRLGVVSYFGDAYDITGLKVKKTPEFLFGIRNFATISGNVYLDLDSNGAMGSLELSGAAASVYVYDENGNELAASTTSSSARSYKFSNLPYDTPLYLTMETERPVSPLLSINEVPEALIIKKVIGHYIISKESINPVITQHIGVMGSVPSSVSAILQEFNLETAQATLSLKNTDKLNTTTIYYTFNSTNEYTINLGRAPLFGSAKPVLLSLEATNKTGENSFKSYWKSGVYKINLQDIVF